MHGLSHDLKGIGLGGPWTRRTKTIQSFCEHFFDSDGDPGNLHFSVKTACSIFGRPGNFSKMGAYIVYLGYLQADNCHIILTKMSEMKSK